MSGRIAVAVSGAGSNLRALHAAAGRGELGGEIVLVVADRPCPAIDWAGEHGIKTEVVDDGEDIALAAVLGVARPDVVVLAGYMRIIGPQVLAAYPDRILNTHPSLLPAFPGAHAVRDALAAGAKVTGATVHLVDETLDGGPIVAQEAVSILDADDEAGLHGRIRAVEHRLLPRAVAILLSGAVGRTGPVVDFDWHRIDVDVPVARRALLSVSDKTGLVELGRGLVDAHFELVSTGGTARALRDAGLPVTDVAAVTGFPEMLDGRIKTLHPRVHGGILADRRRPEHRQALIAAAIAPFELVVVNLYPFAAAAERPGISFDELVEEIDIGGPSMVRAAAKNHASVAIVTFPGSILGDPRRPGRGGERPGGAPRRARRRSLPPHRRLRFPDRRGAARRMVEAGLELPDEPGFPSAADPYPPSVTIALEKVETLRYGENPHQVAARYRRPGASPNDGPFAAGAAPLQGKQLSYNNVLDASAAAAIGRTLEDAGCVIVKHTNPCGAAERDTLVDAWAAALAGDPVSAFGGVVALNREVDRETADGLVGIFLELVVAPGFSAAAREILATKQNLRLIVDPTLAETSKPLPRRPGPAGVDPDGRRRAPRDRF